MQLTSRENKGEINISKAEIKSYSVVMNDVINVFKVEFGLLRLFFDFFLGGRAIFVENLFTCVVSHGTVLD